MRYQREYKYHQVSGMERPRVARSTFQGSGSLPVPKWHFYWLCALVLSFAYERPVAYLTPYDRTNPRLFDVIVAVGILTVLPRLRCRIELPRILRIWMVLVAWFCFCAVVWSFGFLSWTYGKFSLFYAAKYVQGLVALVLVSQISLTSAQKAVLHKLAVIGGVFVATYCILEYAGMLGPRLVMVTDERYIEIQRGVLTGPLDVSYFHLAQYSSFAFVLTLTISERTRNRLFQAAGILVALFVAWPLIFSGSRTGMGLSLFAMFFLFVIARSFRGALVVTLSIVMVVLVFIGWDRLQSFVTSGRTIERLTYLEEAGTTDSIGQRLLLPLYWDFSRYRWSGRSVPFIGAGFYVAPVYDIPESPYYRVGYGVHSMYLFPYEQGGIVAFALFVVFMVGAIQCLYKLRRLTDAVDRALVLALLAYFLSMTIVGVGGHNFWLGSGSGNFNTYALLMLLVAAKPVAIKARNL